MLLVIASLSNCSVIMLKKFSLGFKSELWGGILNILTPTFSITARAKFPLQCPSCEKTFSSFASHYENIKSKFCAIKSEKYLPFILSYLSHIMTLCCTQWPQRNAPSCHHFPHFCSLQYNLGLIPHFSFSILGYDRLWLGPLDSSYVENLWILLMLKTFEIQMKWNPLFPNSCIIFLHFRTKHPPFKQIIDGHSFLFSRLLVAISCLFLMVTNCAFCDMSYISTDP